MISNDAKIQVGERREQKRGGISRRLLAGFAIAFAGILAGVAAALLSTGDRSDSRALEALQQQLVNASVFPEDFRSIPAFSLRDSQGEEVTAALFDGQYSLVFFGFTHCPDVCPLTLSVMQRVVADLESRRVDPMQVVFVTVDPARDTPEVMHRYIGYFDEDFVGVTGTQTAMQNLTGKLGIVAAFSANENNPENYTVDHTASMLLVDPQRRIRAKFNAPHEAGSIVADYLTLRNAL